MTAVATSNFRMPRNEGSVLEELEGNHMRRRGRPLGSKNSPLSGRCPPYLGVTATHSRAQKNATNDGTYCNVGV